jgi:dihydrolipoamide dehydrogenase
MSKKIVVIGCGPGGYPAALKAASLGAQVTLIEAEQAGGVCLNCGCIPSKSLLDAAHKFYSLDKIRALSQDAPPWRGQVFAPDFDKIQKRQADSVAKLKRGLLSLLKNAKINLVQGRGEFISDKEIKAGDETFSFDAAIIAAGTKAFYPAAFEKFKDKLRDNSNVFNMTSVPKSIAILGGGVIGCEFACIFNALGSQVTVIEGQKNLIPLEDEALSCVLKRSFDKRGIRVITGLCARDISPLAGGQNIKLDDGQSVAASEVLVALGRVCQLDSLGLDKIGVQWTRQGIKTDPQTLKVKDNIYAVGDVNGLCRLAHAASAQGEAAAGDIMGLKEVYDNDLIPRAIYTFPEIASVGLTKQEAQARGIEAKAGKAFFLSSGRAVAQDETEGFAQIVSDVKTGLILGAQIAGANATEIAHIPLTAMKAGMKAEDLKKIVFAHPTISEIIKEAV